MRRASGPRSRSSERCWRSRSRERILRRPLNEAGLTGVRQELLQRDRGTGWIFVIKNPPCTSISRKRCDRTRGYGSESIERFSSLDVAFLGADREYRRPLCAAPYRVLCRIGSPKQSY